MQMFVSYIMNSQRWDPSFAVTIPEELAAVFNEVILSKGNTNGVRCRMIIL